MASFVAFLRKLNLGHYAAIAGAAALGAIAQNPRPALVPFGPVLTWASGAVVAAAGMHAHKAES